MWQRHQMRLPIKLPYRTARILPASLALYACSDPSEDRATRAVKLAESAGMRMRDHPLIWGRLALPDTVPTGALFDEAFPPEPTYNAVLESLQMW